jgi:hypothetical protein
MRDLEDEDQLRLLTRTCEKCFKTVLSSRNERVSDYLESLRMPAALIARDQTVLSSNQHFQRMSPTRDVVGLKIGEALECTYSPILGRCSETVACLVCGLKRSVESTWLTRQGLRGVPFSFPHKTAGRKTFVITTEMVGSAVLLLMGKSPLEA